MRVPPISPANDAGADRSLRAADLRMVADAALFAARAHAGQVRSDSGEPYVNHLAEVAAFTAALEPLDPVLVTAAWLHDVVEETEFTLEDVMTLFGPEVAGLVADVTDPPDLKGKARRDRQVTHTLECGPRVKLLKLADKTSNVEDLIGLPGERFDLRGNERYLKWARRVVAVCRGLAPDLEARFDRSAERLDQEIAAAHKRQIEDKSKSKSPRRKGKSRKGNKT
ncbi:phosphohydrolase [Zhengella mangrovi]|uniref:Phosphohydrolase n=1 Tax=Zhengella mangrovi TaxID=1982044 RepID=A0A2G1QU68_9HYPH|nr:HD domain-containing protein [Zhengella mangrovi]PHP69004.1 phosphohydrolase [Zhengella mangrovi]